MRWAEVAEAVQVAKGEAETEVVEATVTVWERIGTLL